MAELYRISWADRETRNSRRYVFDNATRGGPPQYVIQRTIRGCGYLERDGVRALVPKNHVMIFGHGDQTRYGFADESKGPYVLEFLTMTGPHCAEIFTELQRLTSGVAPMPQQSEPARLFDEICRRFKERQFQDAFQESMLLYELLTSLWRDASRIPAERDPVAFAAEYITRRYHQPITMDEVAQAAGISREHLTRRLTRQWGQSPGKRIQELRLKAGKDLVCNTTAPIEAICRHCGYLDPDAFARAFTRRFKLSPSRMRHQYTERMAATCLSSS